jgi:hypothetical protein
MLPQGGDYISGQRKRVLSRWNLRLREKRLVPRTGFEPVIFTLKG